MFFVSNRRFLVHLDRRDSNSTSMPAFCMTPRSAKQTLNLTASVRQWTSDRLRLRFWLVFGRFGIAFTYDTSLVYCGLCDGMPGKYAFQERCGLLFSSHVSVFWKKCLIWQRVCTQVRCCSMHKGSLLPEGCRRSDDMVHVRQRLLVGQSM